jgi:hypothetical protein
MAKRKSGPSKLSKSKRSNVFGWNEFSILRAIVALAILIYIGGIIPSYTKAVSDIFHEPVIKIIFLGLIIAVGYLDPMLGILLAVAFLVSLLSSAAYASSPIGKIVSGTRDSALSVARGAQGGIQSVAVGAKDGVESVALGARDGVQQVARGATTGVRHLVDIPGNIMGDPREQMSDNMDAQRTFEMSQQNGESFESGSDCNVVSPTSNGCDPIVGYNSPYDCVCNGDCGGECDKDKQGCLCKGVETWKDELNAQGLNQPMGYSGTQDGATF